MAIAIQSGMRLTPARLNPPTVALQRTGISIANSTLTLVTWSSALYDSDSLWNGADKVIVKKAGLYMAHFAARFATQAAVVGLRQARVDVNGVEMWSQNDAPTTALNGFNTSAVLTYPLPLIVGDQVQFRVYQNSGGALDLLSQTRAALVWMG